MVQRVEVTLVDDIDGTDDDDVRSLSFGLDGASYEIDLSAANTARLLDILAPYVENGRRLSGKRSAPRGSSSSSSSSSSSNGSKRAADREHLAAVRAWARDNGYTVSDRGRVPVHIQDAFDEAHGV
ncbi:MAG TPA: Lsr2 family protein [Pedococcus sp.]|nr:Lsr2 family protein [Pedococcus sp.]